MKCPTCWLPYTGEPFEEVVCDGCFQWFHRKCVNDYKVIDVAWSDSPQAYIFCKGCDDES